MKNVNSRLMLLAGSLALTITTAFAQTIGAQPRHVALIPIGADLASIKFQSVKAVMIPAESTVATESRYCAEVDRREPGGSMFCPSIEQQSFTLAYRATYSFEGQPLSSDESSNRHFTFSVDFRPEELGSVADGQVLIRKGRAAGEYFAVTTSREDEDRAAIDVPGSTLCAGSYVDGSWVRSDRNCIDRLVYRTVKAKSDYVAVRVEPVRSAAAASAPVAE